MVVVVLAGILLMNHSKNINNRENIKIQTVLHVCLISRRGCDRHIVGIADQVTGRKRTDAKRKLNSNDDRASIVASSLDIE